MKAEKKRKSEPEKTNAKYIPKIVHQSSTVLSILMKMK